MLNFVKVINKVNPSSKEIVRCLLQEYREASSPQLAKITGLSRVTVGKALMALEDEGRAERYHLADSSGGRPAWLYRYRVQREARVCLFTLQRRNSIYLIRMDILNQEGRIMKIKEASYSYLDEGSFDKWLDDAHAQASWKVLYCFDNLIQIRGFRAHMKRRYGMRAQSLSIAELIIKNESDALALCFQRSRTPQAAIQKEGKCILLPHIGLLPQPIAWESLDYSDLSLVEEMMARLMLMICCTISAKRIYLYDQSWTERLISRIKFNLASKLHSYVDMPKLIFMTYPENYFREEMRAFACDFLIKDN